MSSVVMTVQFADFAPENIQGPFKIPQMPAMLIYEYSFCSDAHWLPPLPSYPAWLCLGVTGGAGGLGARRKEGSLCSCVCESRTVWVDTLP